MAAFMVYIYGPVIGTLILFIMRDEVRSIKNKLADNEPIASEATSFALSVFIGIVLVTICLGGV